MNTLDLSIKNDELQNLLLRFSIALISLFTSIVIFSYTSLHNDNGNRFLFLLPLTYGMCFFMLPKISKNRHGSVGLNLLNIVIFLRYIFIPLLIVLTYNTPFYRGTVPNNISMIQGQMLMLIELLTVFIIIELFSNKFYKFNRLKIQYEPVKNTWFLKISLLFSLVPFIIFPDIISRYNFFLSASESTSDLSEASISGFWTILSELAFVLLPLIVINICGKKYKKSYKLRYLLISMISIIPSITLIRGSSRYSILIPAICFLFILIKTFYKHDKLIFIVIGSLSIVIFLIYTFTTRANNPNISNTFFDLQETKEYFDSYLGGPLNMGRIFTTENNYGSFINIQTIMNDWLYNIPGLSSLADGINRTATYFNEAFYGRSGSYDQIVPMTGQAYLHFGYIGSPLYISMSMFIMMYFDSRFLKEPKIEYTYVYIFIIIYSAISMGINVGSLYSRLINTALPVFFVLKINDHFIFKRKDNI